MPDNDHHPDCGCKECAAFHVAFDPRDHGSFCSCRDCCPENPFIFPGPSEDEEEEAP